MPGPDLYTPKELNNKLHIKFGAELRKDLSQNEIVPGPG